MTSCSFAACSFTRFSSLSSIDWSSACFAIACSRSFSSFSFSICFSSATLFGAARGSDRFVERPVVRLSGGGDDLPSPPAPRC